MVKKALNFIIISMFFIVFLYPFLYIVNIAISSSHAITNNEVYLIPKGINFIAFKVVLQSKSILSGYINSIAYTKVSNGVFHNYNVFKWWYHTKFSIDEVFRIN